MSIFSKQKISIVLCIILVVLLSGCGHHDDGISATEVISCPAGRMVTDNMWLQDIDYLHNELPKVHANLYHDMDKETFDREISDLKKDVPKLNKYQIECRIAKIMAMVKDSHTNFNFLINKSESTYPIRLMWFGNDLRVIATDRQHKSILGKKVIAVNDDSINDVIKKVDTLISHENDQWLKVISAQYVTIPEVLSGLKIISRDEVQFLFKGDDNKTIKVKLEPYDITRHNIVQVKDSMNIKPLCLQYDPYNLKESLYWYKYIPKDKILYFQYNSCEDRSTAENEKIKNYKDYPDFNKFSEELLKAINGNDVNKFVVDLRNNYGGDSSLMSSLVPKLQNIQKLQGKNKIFVLIGNKTFSSAVLAADDFKNSTSAVFVGEPTGGNANGYGDVGTLMLPNSKLNVSYSDKYFNRCPGIQGSFMPDVNVEESYEHYKKGIDDAYEVVK